MTLIGKYGQHCLERSRLLESLSPQIQLRWRCHWLLPLSPVFVHYPKVVLSMSDRKRQVSAQKVEHRGLFQQGDVHSIVRMQLHYLSLSIPLSAMEQVPNTLQLIDDSDKKRRSLVPVLVLVLEAATASACGLSIHITLIRPQTCFCGDVVFSCRPVFSEVAIALPLIRVAMYSLGRHRPRLDLERHLPRGYLALVFGFGDKQGTQLR